MLKSSVLFFVLSAIVAVNANADDIFRAEGGYIKRNYQVTKCQRFYKLTLRKDNAEYDLSKNCKGELKNNKSILAEFSNIGGHPSIVFNTTLMIGGGMTTVKAKDSLSGKSYQYYKILHDDVLIGESLKGYKDIKVSHDLNEMQIDERTNSNELVRRILLKAN